MPEYRVIRRRVVLEEAYVMASSAEAATVKAETDESYHWSAFVDGEPEIESVLPC